MRLRAGHLGHRSRTFARGGFTLIEVLATIVMMAIALPAIMRGISLSTQIASDAHRRLDATALGESKLDEIVANSQWQNSATAGDFGPDWPDYRWEISIGNWAADTTSQGLRQIDLRVLWKARGEQKSMTFSTLTYQRQQQQQ